ncbi:MAG: 5'-nucleotidase [Alistipes sp.]|nr:5'-nucleotidase [Candidatus Minthomonas equi]
MKYPIDEKFVVCVTSSALFDMVESDNVFKNEGVEAYKKYQEKNIDNTLNRGVAYPFIKRLLSLNDIFPEDKPVEVVLFSRNSPDAGNRALRSIQKWGLDITRFVFTSGKPNFQYLPAYNSTLFLTSNAADTAAALKAGYAAGTVMNKTISDDEADMEFRLAFDFDSVLADDESEKLFQRDGLSHFLQHEKYFASIPLSNGPLEQLLRRISTFQQMERAKAAEDNNYHPILQTAIVTARSAPAHERVLTTLKEWNISVDQIFFLGGMEKARVLKIMRPHIFFDDQVSHLTDLDNIPAVHVPFGIVNQMQEE